MLVHGDPLQRGIPGTHMDLYIAGHPQDEGDRNFNRSRANMAKSMRKEVFWNSRRTIDCCKPKTVILECTKQQEGKERGETTLMATKLLREW